MTGRTVAAFVIALAAAFYGFSAFYSDLASAERWGTRVAVTGIVLAVGAALAAFLGRRGWLFGVVAACGPLASLAIQLALGSAGTTASGALGASAAALLGGWVGSRLASLRAKPA